MDPKGGRIACPGEETTEPTFGLPAMWIAESLREEASFRGYTVVDPATVLTTHLTEIIKDNLAELLTYAETQKLLDELAKDYQKLVDDLVPGADQRRRHPARPAGPARRAGLDPRSGADRRGDRRGGAASQNVIVITEHVRARLARQISNANTAEAGYIPILTLSPDWEQAFAEALIGQGDDRQLAMAPSRLQAFIAPPARGVRAARDARRAAGAGHEPGGRAPTCARSSSASGRRPWCCRRTRSTPRRESGPSARCEPAASGMRLKTFVAPDARQAMAMLRAALGEDAIIVATHELPDGGVRITGAIESQDLDLAELLAPVAAVALRPSACSRSRPTTSCPRRCASAAARGGARAPAPASRRLRSPRP